MTISADTLMSFILEMGVIHFTDSSKFVVQTIFSGPMSIPVKKKQKHKTWNSNKKLINLFKKKENYLQNDNIKDELKIVKSSKQASVFVYQVQRLIRVNRRESKRVMWQVKGEWRGSFQFSAHLWLSSARRNQNLLLIH